MQLSSLFGFWLWPHKADITKPETKNPFKKMRIDVVIPRRVYGYPQVTKPLEPSPDNKDYWYDDNGVMNYYRPLKQEPGARGFKVAFTWVEHFEVGFVWATKPEDRTSSVTDGKLSTPNLSRKFKLFGGDPRGLLHNESRCSGFYVVKPVDKNSYKTTRNYVWADTKNTYVPPFKAVGNGKYTYTPANKFTIYRKMNVFGDRNFFVDTWKHHHKEYSSMEDAIKSCDNLWNMKNL